MENKPRRPLVAHRRDLEDFEDVARSGLTESDTGADTPEGQTAAFSFSGKRWPLFKIALVNALLTILTLGIYRFWAKTRLRRYFWSNIRIQNEPLEYTGTAMELLIGFLVVLAILVPVFAVYQGALFLAQSSPEWITMGLNVFYGVALLAFFQYAFYRMWRYRFSRTTWRGIRFTQDGSAWKYMGITLAWMVVTIVTLNLAFPWLRNAQWKYRIENLHFGQTACAYNGQAKDLLIKWMIAWVTPVLILVALVFYQFNNLMEIYAIGLQEGTVDADAAARLFSDLQVFYFAFPAVTLALAFSFIWYRAHEANYVFRNSQFAGSDIDSTLKPISVIGIIVLYMVVLITAVMGPVALIGTVILKSPALIQMIGGAVAFAPLAMAIYAIVAASIMSVIVLNFGLARHLCSHLVITNAAALELATQTKEHKPEFGEGLADALDVGAF